MTSGTAIKGPHFTQWTEGAGVYLFVRATSTTIEASGSDLRPTSTNTTHTCGHHHKSSHNLTMGNIESKEEFEAAQKAAREQGRQDMVKKLEDLAKLRWTRERPDTQTAPEDGELTKTSRRDSGSDGIAGVTVKSEQTVEQAVRPKREPNDTSNERASDRATERGTELAAERARLEEREAAAKQELAAAIKQSSSRDDDQDPLTQWNPRKQPRAREGANITPLITSAAPDSRKKSTEVTDPRSPKRTAPDSGFGDERRSDGPSKRKPSSSSVPRSPGQSSGREPPKWYSDLKRSNTRGKQESEAEPLLNGLKIQISKAQDQMKKPQNQQHFGLHDAFNKARDFLHKIAFAQVTKQGLRDCRIFDNESGLSQIFESRFAGGVPWPFDIKADAEELYNKWYRQDFETDLMRGIICGKPSLKSGKEKHDRTSDRLRDDWPRRGANYTGHGKLLNGQWWPTQLTCLRDDAHGSSQAGVFGGNIEKGEGAYSCVMSGGHGYADDKDNGDWVYYCGTDSDNGKVTDATQRLMNSVGQTVRLIRSHQLQSDWAPVVGFRYDGLYEVQDYKRIDPEGHPRARYQFKLVRVPGQDPIRGGKGPERRPTQQEVEACDKDKRLRGLK